ncbi:putative XRE-type DNA-binding protein [Allocatelliglobosispora scoriae]|uniref:Putative XRE-type DNA-binding protein n=1 Tax=Allocatelliglobosispora scoriae TaxID=643052 RepID=A0A841BQL8_9ACTN|nr:sigma factor-like helix-turn-helix DNA-binding protein [Allocatelliglobosispora scoriae]MBB5869678.1 putative XRE-type DNA-binding protein [Allocatelliglobosispora scoriae]
MPKAGTDTRAKLLARAQSINAEIDEHQVAIAELSQERRDCLESLIEDGMTQSQLADHLGMSRGRVSQLLSAGARPERAFFGTGKVTVAIGGKNETGRKDGKPLVVASGEAFGAFEHLATLVRMLGLDAESEIVPPPGMVQLNRANLVVLTSPRLLPFVGQVLDADPHLGFSHDERGWFLVDKTTGTEHRSPSDEGESGDYAYVGRLPRPDGKGTFLYLAGIHAPGTVGAVHYIENHLPELYREVKTRRWSALVSCQFNPDTRRITSSQLVSPIYRHEHA